MKSLFRFAASLAFAVSLASPLFASAADPSCDYAGSAGNSCIQGSVQGRCDSNGFCQASVSAGSVSSGSGINTTYLNNYKTGIIGIINGIFVPVLFSLSFLVFLWGVYKYFIFGADNDAGRETGRQFVLWGVIGFVVILSVWGLVSVVGTTFGLSPGGAAPSYPTL